MNSMIGPANTGYSTAGYSTLPTVRSSKYQQPHPNSRPKSNFRPRCSELVYRNNFFNNKLFEVVAWPYIGC